MPDAAAGRGVSLGPERRIQSIRTDARAILDSPYKVAWSGQVVSVQPRIRLTRSFDERSHSYLGYALRIVGLIGDETREFTVGLGTAAQEKHQFRVGDEASGECVPVRHRELEPCALFDSGGEGSGAGAHRRSPDRRPGPRPASAQRVRTAK